MGSVRAGEGGSCRGGMVCHGHIGKTPWLMQCPHGWSNSPGRGWERGSCSSEAPAAASPGSLKNLFAVQECGKGNIYICRNLLQGEQPSHVPGYGDCSLTVIGDLVIR